MKKPRTTISLALVFSAAMLSSCVLFRPAERKPADTAPTPNIYSEPYRGGIEYPSRWWEAFNDPDLSALVHRALAENQSLAQSAARLEQARALARQRGAGRFPEVSAEGAAAHNRQWSDDPALGETERTWENYSLGLAAGYELDLWGRVYSLTRAARLEAEAVESDYQALAMTLSAETAIRYFDLLATRRTLKILNRQLDTNRRVLDLIELRFRRSQGTALDVLQQREIVKQTESLIPLREAEERTILNELNVLGGRPPQAELKIDGDALPEFPPLPESGLPADLLFQRPDVRAAWQRLEAADWGESSAKADRLPAIRLSASGAFQSDATDTLFDNWFENLAAGIVAPLFDAGRRKAEVDRQKAIVEERLAAYRQTVLNALREVQNALVLEDAQTRHLALLDQQLELAEAARGQAIVRYGRGQESYLRVLSAINSEDTLRRSITDARYQLFFYRVQLYRALGGDWSVMGEE